MTTVPQSWNRYAYTGGNPLKYVDPNGLEWFAVLQAAPGGALRHEAIVDIDLKTGIFGETWEHPAGQSAYEGKPYAGSYGPLNGLTPVSFKFLGSDFNPRAIQDQTSNALYLDGTYQCTTYSEIKQGGRATPGLIIEALAGLGLVKKDDFVFRPILADRKHDDSYQSWAKASGHVSSARTDPRGVTGAIIDGVWVSFSGPMTYLKR